MALLHSTYGRGTLLGSTTRDDPPWSGAARRSGTRCRTSRGYLGIDMSRGAHVGMAREWPGLAGASAAMLGRRTVLKTYPLVALRALW